MRTVTVSINNKAISEALGLPHEGPDVVEQQFEVDDKIALLYLGADAWRGQHHTQETKKILSEKKIGKEPWNKGLPNDIAKDLMTRRNPMKRPEIADKVRKANIGREPHNKIKAIYNWNCEQCGKDHQDLDNVHNRLKRFCNKSCAATYTNLHRSL